MSALLADRAFRRLMALMLSTEFLWGIGAYMTLPSTTLPAFLHARGASPAMIGVMAVAISALMLLPQLFGRGVIDRFAHRKRGVVCMHLLYILAYFLIPLFDYLLPSHPKLVVLLTVGLLAGASLIMGLVIPVWLDMLAQVIPLSFRGRYFGFASGFSAVGGLLGGLALTGLQHWLGAGVYHGAFIGAGCCFILSMTAFFLAPVPEAAFVHPPEPPLRARLHTALAACKLHSDFGRFVASFLAQSLAMAIIPFLVVFATDRHGLRLPESVFTRITMWQACGGIVGALFIGWLVDHRGPRWPWVGVTLIIPLVALLYPAAGALPILFACSLLVGILTTHWSISGPALLELSPAGDKSVYVAIANLAGLAPSLFGPLLFAALIEGPGYPAAFHLALLAGLLATVGALFVRGRRGICETTDSADAKDVM